jgi:hypothetical protein
VDREQIEHAATELVHGTRESFSAAIGGEWTDLSAVDHEAIGRAVTRRAAVEAGVPADVLASLLVN